ncbi:hypothetical protein SPF06_19545 [Sinomonas sp. JGH33]|uniref:Helicase-associated domain-containing protein n=1 Tax=Sinomonas terricola TaxID=3110330 RepID=A0ABU5TBF7_9MICC|nr:hypothetical protein [Sinomonas sp. JGH33]MEA5456923.1 hypothetical protein [Sinomonas sp. JGH33]
MTSTDDASQPRPDFGRRLEGVLAFKAAHCRLPRTGLKAEAAERSLGGWLLRQRRRLARDTLTRPERDALDAALGPWWTLPPEEAWWAENPRAGSDAPGRPARPRRKAPTQARRRKKSSPHAKTSASTTSSPSPAEHAPPSQESASRSSTRAAPSGD